jgi:hypothetical protein
MGYCCAKGMKLAEFHSKNEFDEVMNIPGGNFKGICNLFIKNLRLL